MVGGLGSAVAETLLEHGIDLHRFRCIGLADRFPEVVGDQAFLRKTYGLDRDAVVAAFREMRA